jgi:hypothetical protein
MGAMVDVIRVLSFRARTPAAVVVLLCAVAHASCGYGQEPARPQPAPGTYETIQGRMTIETADGVLTGARVTATFFSSIGQHPLIGRLFVDGEHAPGAGPVVILHHDLWREKFGGRPDIVGRQVQLDGRPFTVVAVMPRGFNAPEGARFWVPKH